LVAVASSVCTGFKGPKIVAFQLLIDGVDYTAYMKRDTLTITEALAANGQTMDVTLIISSQAISKPLGGQCIQFKQDGTLEFAGRIASALEEQIGLQKDLSYQLNCVDYTIDLDTHLITGTYASQLAGDIFRSIIGTVGRGFTSTNVTDGAVAAAVEADYETPSSLLTKVAESMEHQWYVDYSRDVHFFYILDRPAPIPQIDLDADVATYGNCTVEERWEQVKNVVYLTGATAKSSIQDSIKVTGDGDQKFVPLNYPPWESTVTVNLNSAPQEVLLDSVDGMAGDGQGNAGQVYICYDNWGVRFPDNHAPAAGSTVDISYNYGYEPVIKVEDPVSIALMAARENYADAPSDGIHEFKFAIPDLKVTDESAIWDYGNLLLRRYAYPVYHVKWESWVQGWAAGQNLRVFSANNKRAFDQTCYVQSVQKQILKASDGVARFKFTVEASNLPFPG
jgi:hypothetical protein